METFSALLALCAENSPASGEFPSQRPVTRSFDFSLICALNKRLSKHSRGWWFETPSRSLWCHRSELLYAWLSGLMVHCFVQLFLLYTQSFNASCYFRRHCTNVRQALFHITVDQTMARVRNKKIKIKLFVVYPIADVLNKTRCYGFSYEHLCETDVRWMP